MRTALIALVVSAFVLPMTAQADNAVSEEGVKDAITRQLNHYQAALNTSDLDRVMSLYAGDAVFMPQHSPPAVGRDAVRRAYRRVFDTIRLDVRFTVDEIKPLSRDWAFARTRSNGTLKRLSGDQQAHAEGNQEIFLLHREGDGQWRFARYIFSTTNPPDMP
ncbi:SgcJ/EcaC family oxidoreductase [Pseudomonas entomophila]|uniref:YybH family protein n=1 Tax=Pseudomonas entomophila TaxID=312306 RepID=UPI002405E6FB|nr:SgcJ/EcaC family oxidoreductase [Pseudomonas entomophila]MDF9616336.1 SgcJ/EcaC family oxidoreductase [Pseudomonas entomophila]